MQYEPLSNERVIVPHCRDAKDHPREAVAAQIISFWRLITVCAARFLHSEQRLTYQMSALTLCMLSCFTVRHDGAINRPWS
jgi:hypothetical protein